MKKILMFKLTFLLVLAFAVPIAMPAASIVSEAAAPKLNVTKRTFAQAGDTYTLTVKNKPRGAKYTWSTTNKKVAKVNKYGLVTAVGKGSASIRCKITYSNKKTRTLTCKVSVNVPATKVTISNAKMSSNNTHRIEIGDTFDFNRSLTPKTSTDKTYWIVEDESVAIINTKGVMTPKKEGVTRLTAVAAKNKSSIKKSKVTAAIIVSVVQKRGKIESVVPVDSSQIKITFSNPIKADTVIKDKNKLLDIFSIVATRDESGNMAAAYGDLTAELSTDKRVLTITASIAFNGRYNLKITNGIFTESGMIVEEYDDIVKFEDSGKPVYKSNSVDESGVIAQITFSKAIDLTRLGVTRLGRTDNVSLNKVTESILTNTANYSLSKDKKTILLNMSGIALSDQNKTIEIRLSGIKDLVGNETDPNPVIVYARTDTTTKPQAQLITVSRTAYNKITATFSRGLKEPGTLTIGGEKMDGKLDEDDNRIVHFTLTPIAMSYTGSQSLLFANWTSYNVPVNDTNPYKYYTFNMSYSAKGPELANYNFQVVKEGGVEFNRLTLLYDTNVSVDAYGTLTTYVYNSSNSLTAVINLDYTATVKDNTVTMELDTSDMSYSGRYRIKLPVSFARDELYQPSKETEINITKSTSSSSELPAPTSVYQSDTNHSEIFVEFGNKLDPQSAAYKDNYSIGNLVIASATLVVNNDYKATVKLTVLSGTIEKDTDYVLYVSGVKGYNDTYGPISGYQKTVYLRENVPPVIQSARLTNSTTIEILFDESIHSSTSKLSFNVYQGNSTVPLSTYQPTYVSGNSVIINLAVSITNADSLHLVPRGDCVIKDYGGNELHLSGNSITITN